MTQIDGATEKALAVLSEQDAGALVPGTPWTRSQAMTLVRTIAPGLSPDEFKLFAYRCEHAGLDPFAGQIHPVVRIMKGERKLCIQTGIDGFRLIAHRTKECAGIDEPVFEYGPNADKPIAATCTVYRIVKGQRCAFTATARWSEFYPGGKQGFMWDSKPHVMLGKCAEAQAHRRAFPLESGQVYAEEELAMVEAPESGPSPGAKDLNDALAPFDGQPVEQAPEPQEAPQEPAQAEQPTLEVYRALCAGYKAYLGEDAYHALLAPFTPDKEGKSNLVPAPMRERALDALQAGCVTSAPEGAPFPAQRYFAEAQGMKKPDLQDGIGALEDSMETDLSGPYLECPVGDALVAPLRVYHAHLSELAWAESQQARSDSDTLFGQEGGER